MGLFGKIRETFRDHARDNICAGLQKLGIDAQMAPRERAEENIGGKKSLGIIDIPAGAIRWINVCKVDRGQGPWNCDYYIDYGVPNSKLEPNLPVFGIRSVYKRDLPRIGKVVDLRWEGGKELGLAVIERLNSDVEIKQPLMETRNDVFIIACTEHGCWVISTFKTRDVPSKELWNCYQRIGQHLLGVKIPLREYAEDGSLVHESTNKCPECGSSNINKAVKRMPKSQQEIETLGFKCEWDCLCVNCRHEWVEREK